MINKIMGKKHTSIFYLDAFPNKTESTNKEISKSLNNYFCNIASIFAQNIYLAPRHFHISMETTTQEIEVIKNLK